MKAAIPILLVLWGLSQVSQQTQRQLTEFEARVTSVHDGDTFTVETTDQKWVCRLENVDAPELAQPYGITSRDSVRNLLLGRRVRVRLIGQDSYRRWRVLVWVGQPSADSLNGSGRLIWQRVDSLVVAKGWAWHYSTNSRDQVCRRAMQAAIEQHIGLWQAGKPVAPWVYRRQSHGGVVTGRVSSIPNVSGNQFLFFIWQSRSA